jgi:transcriptional regulator with XRE-family HTH domain
MYSIMEGQRFRQHISRQLRLLIESEGVTQTWLAKKSNVDPSTISDLCNSKKIPHLYTLNKIIKAFSGRRVTLDYFVGDFNFKEEYK